MDIKIGLTETLTNTCYAPLVALFAHYQQRNLFAPLRQVQIPMRLRDFTPASNLEQVLLSILAGCETLSEVNPHLRQERVLTAALGIPRLADQSSLSRTLDALTLKVTIRLSSPLPRRLRRRSRWGWGEAEQLQQMNLSCQSSGFAGILPFATHPPRSRFRVNGSHCAG